MHTTALARQMAIAHGELTEIAAVLAEHYDLQASAAELRSIIYAVKKSDVVRLRQTQAIAALLREIARKNGLDVAGDSEVSADDLENVPDAGDESEPVNLEEKPTPSKEKPKADDDSFVNDAEPFDENTPVQTIKADPRPKPKKDK